MIKKDLNKGYVQFNYIEPDNEPLYMRIPIRWDANCKTWRGLVEIPNTDVELHISGNTQEEFQECISRNIQRLLFIYPYTLEHIKGMCMPAWYWDEV